MCAAVEAMFPSWINGYSLKLFCVSILTHLSLILHNVHFSTKVFLRCNCMDVYRILLSGNRHAQMHEIHYKIFKGLKFMAQKKTFSFLYK